MTAMGSNQPAWVPMTRLRRRRRPGGPPAKAQPELSEQSNAVAPGRPGPSGTASAGPENRRVLGNRRVLRKRPVLRPRVHLVLPARFGLRIRLALRPGSRRCAQAPTQSTPSHRFQGGHCGSGHEQDDDAVGVVGPIGPHQPLRPPPPTGTHPSDHQGGRQLCLGEVSTD